MAAHLTEHQGETATSRRGVLRRLLVALAVTVASAGVAYGVGVWWFGTHFVPGTTVDGTDVGWMDAGELATLAERRVAAYENHVTGHGVDLVVTAHDIDLTINGATYATSVIEQVNPYVWPLSLVSPPAYDGSDATLAFDHDKLAALVTSAADIVNEDATPPVDATGAWSDDAGAFVITNPVAGTMVDAAAATDTLADGVTDLASATTLDGDDLVQPAITADDPTLRAAVGRANDMVALTIPLVRGDAGVGSVGAGEISSWVRVTPERTVAIDRDAIVGWASGELAERVAGDDEVHVWSIDAEATADAIAEAIDAVSDSPVEVAMSLVEERPPESDGARERGRHVDVNLSNQFARLYDADRRVLWRSYVVSGNTSTGHGTITGTFAIQSKVRDMVLVGLDEDHDGEPDYKTPVRYWMPFSGGFGLHDADWRYYFGGSIYTWNGSHGCVNLPVERAAALFDLINVGDAVVVHW